MSNINEQVVSATKWSTISEVVAKLVSPISSMILARLLTPEAFGIMVTAIMVISFAEIFTDAGFQKYLIQHKFSSESELYKSTSVAFWSNLCFSLLIWVAIIIFSDKIATLVGNEGYGLVISVSCFCIPLSAFSSIQMALYKRSLDFKTLFLVRIVGVLVPLFVTIPLALLTRSYWSLIIGMIALNLSNAIILTVKSKWKPKFFYKLSIFKEMFSFTMWSMLEAISIWLTNYIDMFIVGTMLSQHYLGIYRTSMTTVGQFTGIITSATTPVLFSALSKLQDNDEQLKKMYFSFQKSVSLLIIPLGLGIFLFSDLITSVLLGQQWIEASHFIGIWGLTSALTIVFSYYASELYRAKGRPKLSVLTQVLHLCCLIPAVYWAANQGFTLLCDTRALIRITLIIINLVILYNLMHISFKDMFKNIYPSLVAGIAMSTVVIILLSINSNIYLQCVYCVIAFLVYIGVICFFPKDRELLLQLKSLFIKRKK